MTAQVTLVGNATRDPELRFSPGGMAVANFGMAVNRKYNDKEEVGFFDVTAFGSLAENISECVVRGMRVVVVGRLTQRSWEKNDGTKQSKVEINADEVSPSLRWATAEVTKVDRDGERPEPARSNSRPAQRGARSDGGSRSNGGGFARPARPTEVPFDEEPFIKEIFEGEDFYAPGTRRYRD